MVPVVMMIEGMITVIMMVIVRMMIVTIVMMIAVPISSGWSRAADCDCADNA